MSVTVFVPTIPARREVRAALVEQLRALFPRPLVWVREQSDDETYRENLIRGYRLAAIGVEYVLRIDDDAVLCPGFGDRARSLVARYSPDVMTLHSRAARTDMAALRRGEEINVARYVHGTALLMRAAIAVAYAQHLEVDPLWDNRSGRSFMRFWKGTVLNAVPSLVQHRTDVRSSLGPRPRNRTSATFREVFGG